MVFKAYSVQSLAAATSFVQDLKLGHYVKVPPRATFMGTFPSFAVKLILLNSFSSANDCDDTRRLRPSRS